MTKTTPTPNIVAESAASSPSTSTNDADAMNIVPTNDADDLEGMVMIIDNYMKCSSILLVLPNCRRDLLSPSRPIVGIRRQEESRIELRNMQTFTSVCYSSVKYSI